MPEPHQTGDHCAATYPAGYRSEMRERPRSRLRQAAHSLLVQGDMLRALVTQTVNVICSRFVEGSC